MKVRGSRKRRQEKKGPQPVYQRWLLFPSHARLFPALHHAPRNHHTQYTHILFTQHSHTLLAFTQYTHNLAVALTNT